MLAANTAGVFAMLDQGVAKEEHAEFVNGLRDDAETKDRSINFCPYWSWRELLACGKHGKPEIANWKLTPLTQRSILRHGRMVDNNRLGHWLLQYFEFASRKFNAGDLIGIGIKHEFNQIEPPPTDSDRPSIFTYHTLNSIRAKIELNAVVKMNLRISHA
jgi:hypothetical protein